MEQGQNKLTAKAMTSPVFYEELLLLKAQELILRLMEEQNVSKADLAHKLKKSKAHVTGLLADGRNLTLKSLARICCSLGAEVNIDFNYLGENQGKKYEVSANNQNEQAASFEAVFAAPRCRYLH